MDALVQSVTEQLGTGHTTIHFGPPAHLSTQEFVELQRVQRQRTQTFRLQERQDGRSYGTGASVIGANHVPQATGVPATVPGKEQTVATKNEGEKAKLEVLWQFNKTRQCLFESNKDKAIAKFVMESAGGIVRQVVIDISVLLTLSAANSSIPNPFTIALKEWDVCIEGVSKNAVFISSEPYDPPP